MVIQNTLQKHYQFQTAIPEAPSEKEEYETAI